MNAYTLTEEARAKLRLNAAKASQVRRRNAALRAADDPDSLARAARIVRAAIHLGHLTLTDLDGPIVPPEADR